MKKISLFISVLLLGSCLNIWAAESDVVTQKTDEYKGLYYGTSYNTEIPGDVKFYIINKENILLREEPSFNSKTISETAESISEYKIDYIQMNNNENTKKSNLWYRFKKNNKVKGWMPADEILVRYNPKHETKIVGSVEEIVLYLNHKDGREGGYLDLYASDRNWFGPKLIAKNICNPRYRIDKNENTVYIQYNERKGVGYYSDSIGEMHEVSAKFDKFGGIHVYEKKKDKKVLIAGKELLLEDIVKMPQTAHTREDWVLFKQLEHGWGPNGGNVFLKFDDNELKMQEIYSPWSKDKKLLLEFSEKLPQESIGKTIYHHEVYGFYNNKLWVGLFWGEYNTPPKALVYLDFSSKEIKYYLNGSFPKQVIPYVKKIVLIEESILLLGQEKFHYNYEKPEDLLKSDDVFVYILDIKHGKIMKMKIN